MASYDSSGFQDMTPAGPVIEFTGAAGSPTLGALPDTDSAGAAAELGTIGSSAFVVPNFGSLVNGVRVNISPSDSLVSSQAGVYGAAADPLTGIGSELGSSGAGEGAVAGPRHPNAQSVGSLASQIEAARRPS
jgi:hypothetical protein